jgi:hypothetical protein
MIRRIQRHHDSTSYRRSTCDRMCCQCLSRFLWILQHSCDDDAETFGAIVGCRATCRRECFYKQDPNGTQDTLHRNFTDALNELRGKTDLFVNCCIISYTHSITSRPRLVRVHVQAVVIRCKHRCSRRPKL